MYRTNMFTKIVRWSNEDNCFVVIVPALLGCFADGKTEMQAIENANTVIEEWLEVAQKTGITIPVENSSL